MLTMLNVLSSNFINMLKTHFLEIKIYIKYFKVVTPY